MPHKFNPAHMARLESDERRRRQPPERLLGAIGLSAGDRMADIGCGPGFYAVAAAHLVGSTGRVFALDLQPEMVDRVRERAAADQLDNLEPRLCEESRLPLPDGATDKALVANVLHECLDRVAFLREVRRILVPGGQLAVVEWRAEAMEMGPPLAERMTADETRAALAAAGFAEIESLAAETTGATHYGVVARAAAES
jgi:ubiquinone/menaquinone biosynthesis C-methylase UbiE